MIDLISRQAAIDAIANCTNCGDEKTLRAYVAKHSLEIGWTGGILDAIDAIEDLPSAQPEEAIPVSWIEAIIKKFMMAGDAFSGLTASIIRVMLNEWKREQERRTE